MSKSDTISEYIRTRIQKGEYPPGKNLPPYRELATLHNTGLDTIHRALEPLEAAGLIQPIPGSGIRVRVRPPQRRLHRGTRINHDPATGYRFPAATNGEKWIAHGTPCASWETPPPRVAALLHLDDDETAIRRRRVMSPEGEPPFSVTDTWLPRRVVEEVPQVGEADTGPGGFLRRLEEAGHGPLSWTQYAQPGLPGEVEARLLGISVRMPVMVLVRPGVSARSGEVVEVTVTVCPGDRVELVVELERGPSAEWPVETEPSDG